MSLQVKATFKPRGDLGQFVKARVTPVVKMAVEESCALIEQKAKALCPVDTGRLQASIKSEVTETEKTVRGTVGTNVHYAPYVEFGTGIAGASSPGAGPGPYSQSWPGMKAQPYLRPAIDSSREEVKAIFANDLEVGLK